ncbi:MAG: IS110 family transposase [Bradymonadales bacterium]|nr:IS110 family transposase [Bradymonadales bacterium]
MEHIAIDLGGRESQICVRASDGTIVEERRCLTAKLEGYLKQRPPSRVIVETCAEAFTVADAALAVGHEARVVPATMVRSLGVGSRRLKSDVRDARILSEVSCRIDLPSVHIPSVKSRQIKTLCGMRETLVETRTKLVNTVRSWLRGQAVQLRSGAVVSFPLRVRVRVETLPGHVDRLLEVIEQLNAEIREADRELEEQARTDEVCRRLMTVPGVGPVTAMRFLAAIDEIRRFGDAHSLESYLGLVPGENSSSDRRRLTSITKAGATKLRWALIQACWAAFRCAPKDPMVLWATEVQKRRGKRIAVVALARKMAGILFAIWRDQTTYDPNRGAQKPEIQPTRLMVHRRPGQAGCAPAGTP